MDFLLKQWIIHVKDDYADYDDFDLAWWTSIGIVGDV